MNLTAEYLADHAQAAFEDACPDDASPYEIGKAWRKVGEHLAAVIAEAEAEARSVGAPAGYYPLHPKGMACKWIRSWTDGQGQYWCCNQGQDLPTPPKAEGK